MKGETTKQALCSVYRVIELADETGVYCGKLLADLGADVIKVEPPGGDKARSWPPFFHHEIGTEKSHYFLYYNTNKRSTTLNLECEEEPGAGIRCPEPAQPGAGHDLDHALWTEWPL